MNRFVQLAPVLAVIVAAGCGIFEPRGDVEQPRSEMLQNDRFEFNKILEKTGRNFVGKAYVDLFGDEFVYTYNRIYTRNKDDHIAYLEDLLRGYPRLKITWPLDTSDGKQGWYFGTDSGTIYRKYYIWKVDSTAAGTTQDFSGQARFEVRYVQEQHGWAITRWYDESADGFFHHFPD